MLPDWTISARYADVERAYQNGRLTEDQWCGYRALWRYSAPRFSNLVVLPRVRDINAQLDRDERGGTEPESC